MNQEEQLEHVRNVLARHKATLLALPEASGVGIGAGDAEGTYAIVVYLRSRPRDQAGPAILEDVAVKYLVTGPIKPLTKSPTDH